MRSEVETLLAEDEATLEVIERRLSQKTGELALAQTRLRQRADSYVAPMFEDIAALSREVASAESEDRRLQLVLDQWDERDEISNTVRSLRLAAEQQRRRVEEKKAQIERRRELVQEFSETFDEIVSELELAWYETAAVDLTTFMPLIGDSDFESLSGGQRTVVSVAYHLALLTVGLVHPGDVRIPSLLILDTPSKYLGAKDSEQVARDYRRIASIVDAYQLPLQIVVADNDPPPKGVSPSNLIELSYESPLVPGLDHPGGDAVVPIHDEYEAE